MTSRGVTKDQKVLGFCRVAEIKRVDRFLVKGEKNIIFFVNLIRDHQKTESEKSELEIHAKSGHLTNLIGRFLS